MYKVLPILNYTVFCRTGGIYEHVKNQQNLLLLPAYVAS